LYDEYTVVALAATPAAGSQFVAWSGGPDCNDGTVTMTSAKSCAAQFDLLPPPQYTLSVTKTGTGTGTVTSNPVGIDCGADCTELYDEDTVVTLAATPAAGSQFVAWSGGPDCNDGTVTMTSARSCTAQFDLTPASQHLLLVFTVGTGSGRVTSSPSGIDCGGDCSEPYDEDTVVTLTATPAADSQFAGWSGGSDCTDGTLTMRSPVSCTAQFDLLPGLHRLSVSKTGTGSGTVTSLPGGIDCGSDCESSFADGTYVVLTPAPDSGSSFEGWSGDADCYDRAVTMTRELTCIAEFSGPPPAQYPLSVTKTGLGSGTVISIPFGILCGHDCLEYYSVGTVVSLTALPAADSQFAGWSGPTDCADGTVQVGSAMNCAAQFDLLQVPNRYSLAVMMTGTGSGLVTSTPGGIDCGADCDEMYPEGTFVVLTPAPDSGSSFKGWSGDMDCIDRAVTMSHDMTCVAEFSGPPPPQFTLSVFKTGSGSGTVLSVPAGINCGVDCMELYAEGTVVSLTAVAVANSSFVGWDGDADCADGTIAMDAARSCTAQFDLLQQTQWTLTVTRTGAGSGVVTSYPTGIDCGADCDEPFNEGTYVLLTPAPDPGSSFAGWTGDPDCIDRAVTMVDDLGCFAEFTTEPAPLPPDGLTGKVVQHNRIELTWIDNAPDEDEYRVERRKDPNGGFLLIASYPANTVRYLDDDVIPGSTFTYRVLACRAGICSDPSNEVTITHPAFRIFVGVPE
jgi:uncharacterized protein (DUF2141 family)